MKLAPAIEYIPATVRLAGHVQGWDIVTLISFLNDIHSNFLNAFFKRPSQYSDSLFAIIVPDSINLYQAMVCGSRTNLIPIREAPNWHL